MIEQMKEYYVAIHIHEMTSNCNGYMDSCTHFNDYIDLAAEQGMKAIAFTNHGGIYDWIKKKQMCDEKGIKYIHAVELYLCINLEDNTRGFHICLYAKNWEGVKELNTLISISTSKGINSKSENPQRHYYYNPRISFEELMNTSDNIIVGTACLAGALWRLSKDIREEEDGIKAYEYNIEKRDELLEWLSKNKHRCFLEIQYHNCDHQIEYNKMLYKWSKKYGIPLIAGTDTHSSNKYKAECRKILQKSKDCYYGEEDEFDLVWKTYDELVECFKNQNALPEYVYLEAIENTNKLADMIEHFDLDYTYKYPTLYGKDADKIWKVLIKKKLIEKIQKGAIPKKLVKQYTKRIYEEYEAMSKQGMSSFMIFMSELMTWCRENNINSSPCRGSVGGSLVAFITDITDVDAIKWNTVFSRFCNADRVSLADIDADFSPSDREKVYQYIIDRFGSDKVSYILTMSTMKDRGVIDVLAKGLDYDDLDFVAQIKDTFDEIFVKYARIIQEEVNLEELEGAESKSPSFIDHYLYLKVIKNKKARDTIEVLREQWDKLRDDNEDLFYYFDGLKGVVIAKGNHPAGMIGSPITLRDNLGVFYKDGDENFPVSFCSMKAVDSVNYVKFDILGLKTIGILQDVYEYTGKGWEYSYEIDWDDKKVWEDMLTSNVGIFQFEKPYSFKLLVSFIPKTINDTSLVNAALRPSGKSYRDSLIARIKHKNPSSIIDNLLKENYGYLVFQEDTTKFLTNVCGFTDAVADLTRRAIGKKNKKLLNEQLPKILEGYCSVSKSPREVAEEEAKEFIQIVSDSAEYQFGFNHSTGYSMNGYRMARARYYHPLEFATAYFNRAENAEDIGYANEFIKYKGFILDNPKFGFAKGRYFFDKKNNTIYKGVGSIKGLSILDGDKLYEISKNKYNNFMDLYGDIKLSGIDVGKVEALIKLDYFSDFGRRAKILKLLNIYNDIFGKKQFSNSKEKLDKLNLTFELVAKYSKKHTAKTFKDVDIEGLMKEMADNVENKDISLIDILKAENDLLGYPITVSPALKGYYFVKAIDVYKNKSSSTYYVNTYLVEDGTEHRLKIKNYQEFAFNPIQKEDIVLINNIRLEEKKKMVEVLNGDGSKKLDANGKVKKKWFSIPNEFWEICDEWKVMR